MTKLDKIMPLIAKVVEGNDLTAREAEDAFTTIFLHDHEGYHYSILISAIHTKGETPDELLGFHETYRKLSSKVKINGSRPKVVTDLSGTGGGRLKTINVSTAASFIVSTAGYTVAKTAFYGVTSPTGSADVFAAFGIDPANLKKKTIESALNNIGICPVYAPFFSPKFSNQRMLSKRFFGELKMKTKTPFHVATNMFSPLPIKRRVYGCYAEKYLMTLAEVFMKLGFKKTLTFYGEPGLPEISNVGKTIFVEQNGKNLKRYSLTPHDLGIKKATAKQIQTGGKRRNIIDFLHILMGKEKSAKSDLVAINAAASLYVLGETKSICDSVPKAQRIIKEGEGFKVLEKLVKHCGNYQLLQKWLRKASIS